MGKAIGDLQNDRLSRLRQKIAQYNFNIKWVARKIHHAADAMSCYPVFEAYPEFKEETAKVSRVKQDPRLEEMEERCKLPRDNRCNQEDPRCQRSERVWGTPSKGVYKHLARAIVT